MSMVRLYAFLLLLFPLFSRQRLHLLLLVAVLCKANRGRCLDRLLLKEGNGNVSEISELARRPVIKELLEGEEEEEES